MEKVEDNCKEQLDYLEKKDWTIAGIDYDKKLYDIGLFSNSSRWVYIVGFRGVEKKNAARYGLEIRTFLVLTGSKIRTLALSVPPHLDSRIFK